MRGAAPLESVHHRKRTQVRKMARRWLSARSARPRVADLRFDAIGVTLDAEGHLIALEHVEGAF
jgi:putative endonuclease